MNDLEKRVLALSICQWRAVASAYETCGTEPSYNTECDSFSLAATCTVLFEGFTDGYVDGNNDVMPMLHCRLAQSWNAIFVKSGVYTLLRDVLASELATLKDETNNCFLCDLAAYTAYHASTPKCRQCLLRNDWNAKPNSSYSCMDSTSVYAAYVSEAYYHNAGTKALAAAARKMCGLLESVYEARTGRKPL